MVLNHDLIYRPKTAQDEKILFLLDHFGLELVEVTEARTVWVARYDGRPLKDYHRVAAPVPYERGGKRTAGMWWSERIVVRLWEASLASLLQYLIHVFSAFLK